MDSGESSSYATSMFQPQAMPQQYTPIDMLPDMRGGSFPSSAIRNFDPSMGQPSQAPLMSASSSSPLPTYSDLMQLLLSQQQQLQNNDDMCKRIAEHLKSCSKCARKYVVDTNNYVAIIIGLVLFVLFLLTKIIDRFG